jgi:hypothetical protein
MADENRLALRQRNRLCYRRGSSQQPFPYAPMRVAPARANIALGSGQSDPHPMHG